jgi:hypothetical protein
MTLKSSIPLFGLKESLTVKRISSSKSFGVLVDGSSTNVYTNLKCRITTLKKDKDEDQKYLQGRDSQNVWKIISKYAPNILENDIFTISAGTLVPAGDYKVFYVHHQKDNLGAVHHTTSYVEKL